MRCRRHEVQHRRNVREPRSPRSARSGAWKGHICDQMTMLFDSRLMIQKDPHAYIYSV